MSSLQATPPTLEQQLQDARTAYQNAEAKAAQWQGVADGQRERIGELERYVADMEASCKNYREAINELEKARDFWKGKCVSPTGDKPTITPLEEAQVDTCPRCNHPLENIERGISVVAGGIRVCTVCLNPGEMEVARARSLSC